MELARVLSSIILREMQAGLREEKEQLRLRRRHHSGVMKLHVLQQRRKQVLSDDNPRRDSAVLYGSIGTVVAVLLLAGLAVLLFFCVKKSRFRTKARKEEEKAVANLLEKLAKTFMLSGDQLIEAYANFTIDYEKERRLLSDHNCLANVNHRYYNVKCLKSTVIRLPGVDDKNLFNANFVQLHDIPNKFIACEAPAEDNVEQFYDICFEQEVELVIMLCQWVESDKEKAFPYFDDKETRTFGKYKVLVSTPQKQQFVKGGYRQRELKVTAEEKKGKSSRKIVHVHWEAWEDMSVPKTADFRIVDELVQMVNKQKKPVIVHCSAGVGRSGSFILAHAAWHLLRRQPSRLGNLTVLVKELRQQRCQSIQNFTQLFFVAAYIVRHIQKDFVTADSSLCDDFLAKFNSLTETDYIVSEGRRLAHRMILRLVREGKMQPVSTRPTGPMTLSTSCSRSREKTSSKDKVSKRESLKEVTPFRPDEVTLKMCHLVKSAETKSSEEVTRFTKSSDKAKKMTNSSEEAAKKTASVVTAENLSVIAAKKESFLKKESKNPGVTMRTTESHRKLVDTQKSTEHPV